MSEGKECKKEAKKGSPAFAAPPESWVTPFWGSHNNLARVYKDMSTYIQKITPEIEALSSSSEKKSEEQVESLEKDKLDVAAVSQDYASLDNRPCLATEKMDGANVCVHIKQNGASGETFVRIIGRKQTIWTSGEGKKLNQCRCGAGSMGALPEVMIQFVLDFMKHEGLTEAAVYGEGFRTDGQAKMSWHPFGYRGPKQKKKDDTPTSNSSPLATAGGEGGEEQEDGEEEPDTFFLTSKLHTTFMTVAKSPVFGTHEELFAHLRLPANKDVHLICPPPVLYRGTVGHCIQALHLQMTQQKGVEFEGVVVAFEEPLRCWDIGVAKFKTPYHEEQPIVAVSSQEKAEGLVAQAAKMAKEAGMPMPSIGDLHVLSPLPSAEAKKNYDILMDIWIDNFKVKFEAAAKAAEVEKQKAAAKAEKQNKSGAGGGGGGGGDSKQMKAADPMTLDIQTAFAHEMKNETGELPEKKRRGGVVDRLVKQVLVEIERMHDTGCPEEEKKPGFIGPYEGAALQKAAKTIVLKAIMSA